MRRLSEIACSTHNTPCSMFHTSYSLTFSFWIFHSLPFFLIIQNILRCVPIDVILSLFLPRHGVLVCLCACLCVCVSKLCIARCFTCIVIWFVSLFVSYTHPKSFWQNLGYAFCSLGHHNDIFSPQFFSAIFLFSSFLLYEFSYIVFCVLEPPSSILSQPKISRIYRSRGIQKRVECGERESQFELCVRLLLYTKFLLVTYFFFLCIYLETNLEHIHS